MDVKLAKHFLNLKVNIALNVQPANQVNFERFPLGWKRLNVQSIQEWTK